MTLAHLPRPKNQACRDCRPFPWSSAQLARIGVDINGDHHPACPLARLIVVRPRYLTGPGEELTRGTRRGAR